MRSPAVLAALLVSAAYLIGGMKLAGHRRLVRIMVRPPDRKTSRGDGPRHAAVPPHVTAHRADVPVELGRGLVGLGGGPVEHRRAIEPARDLARQRAPTGRASPPVLAAVAFLAAGVLLVDLGTAVVSVLPAVFGWGLWRRRRRASAQRRQSAAAASVGPCADLLAACLYAGASVEQALSSITPVAPPLLRERLDQVGLALRTGATAAEAWEPVRDLAALDALARAVVRAETTGAPLAATMSALADELRRERRWDAEAAARKAGVYAVAPLVVCFLPAFLLLGVVPVVVGIAADALRLS